MPFSLALSRNRASSAMAIASAKPMPTKPLVATVSPERIRPTASRADLILPSALEAGYWKGTLRTSICFTAKPTNSWNTGEAALAWKYT